MKLRRNPCIYYFEKFGFVNDYTMRLICNFRIDTPAIFVLNAFHELKNLFHYTIIFNIINLISILFRTEIAVLVKPRILIPNISQCYEEIVLNKNTVSVGHILLFAAIKAKDFLSLTYLVFLFLPSLQLTPC